MITLTEGKLLHEWGDVYERCQGETEGFVRAVGEHLTRLQPKESRWERESASPGAMKGFTGKRRPAVVVSNKQFKEHVVCIMARPFGGTLNVALYLSGSTRAVILRILERIPIVNRLLSAIGLLRDMDVFDRQDFHAWVAVVRLAVDHAIHDVTAKRDLEVKIDWKSKGMFGVA